MAFTQSSLVDIIFKKYITNKSTVDNSKQYFEEPYSSSKNVFTSDVWLQSDQIPTTATNVPGIVQFITATLSYVVGTKGAFYASSMVDIIPPSYNSSYNYGIFRNDGTTQISLGQCDWLFDPNAGVLTFYSGAVNGTITDPQTSTVIASPALPPVIKAYKYIGRKGVVANLNGLTYSGGTMSINVGTGLTLSNGQLSSISSSLSAGQGLSLVGNTFSVSVNSNGLTFSNNNLSLLIGSGLTFSNNQLQTLQPPTSTVAGNGLTNSGNTFSINTSNNSGLTVSNSGLSLSSTVAGSGLTFSNGQISLTNPIFFTNGITSSGNTYSVNISNNGLTFSNGQILLNIGGGLTFSSGQLQSISSSTSVIVGNGLTNSNNTISILLDQTNPGLTVSSSGVKLLPSLIVSTSSVTLSNNVIGQYTSDPTSNSDWGVLSIPSKGYVDSIASGLNLKQAVRVAATGSVNISSAPTQIDGITLSVNDRVLLWRQDGTSNGTSSNGIYVYNGGGSALTRAIDFDGSPLSEVTTGSYTFVTDGSTYQGAGFVIVTIGTASGQILVGTQSMRWTQFNGNPTYVWNNGLILNGLTIDVDLAPNSGMTFSSGQLSINLPSNSGLQLSSGSLSLSSNISGAGITFSSGQLGLNLGSGLITQNNQLSLNLGSGLTTSQNVLNLTRMIGTSFPGTAVGGQIFIRTDLGLSGGVPYFFNDISNNWRGFSRIISDIDSNPNTATSSDFAFVVLPATMSSDTLFGYPLFQVYPQGGFVANSRRSGTLPSTSDTTVSVSDWPYIFRIAQTNLQGPRLGFYAAGTTSSNWIIQTDNGMTSSGDIPPALEIQRVGQTIIGRSSGSRGLIVGELSGSPLSKLHIVGVGSGNLGYLSVSPNTNTDRELISLTSDENFGINGQLGLDTSSLSGAFISPNNPSIVASMSTAIISQLKTGNNIRLIQGATSGGSMSLSFGSNPLLIREIGTNSITLNGPCTNLGGLTASLTRVIFNDKPTSHFQYQGLFSIGNPLTITGSGALPSVAISGLGSRNDSGSNFTGITTSSTFYSVDTTSQNMVYTLPDARITPGRVFIFNKVDSSTNSVTLQTSYTQSIFGLTSQSLWNQFDSMTLVARSTGTQGFWEVQSIYRDIQDKMYIRSRNSSATYSIFYVNDSNNSSIFTITNNRNIGIGTSSPTNLFHIFGTGSNFRLQDGSHANGRYLVCDSNGVASWTSSVVLSTTNIANGLTSNGLNQLATIVDNSTGLYNNGNGAGSSGGSFNWINWRQIIGSGLTWSGSQLNTTSNLLQKYAATITFTASQPQTVTHNLNTTDFAMQIFDTTTGDEVLAQYTNRTINDITVTTYENIVARVVAIG